MAYTLHDFLNDIVCYAFSYVCETMDDKRHPFLPKSSGFKEIVAHQAAYSGVCDCLQLPERSLE